MILGPQSLVETRRGCKNELSQILAAPRRVQLREDSGANNMAHSYKHSPVLTVGEVAYFLSAQADTMRWSSEVSVSHGYRIEPTGWLMVQVGRGNEPDRRFSLPVARIGGSTRR